MDVDELHGRIEQARHTLGSELVVLGHHYQSDDVIRHVDFQGDSLELARRVPGLKAKFIVFCGVSFMAETAALLAAPGQSVLIPDTGAHCCMAGTTPAMLLATVLERITAAGRKVVPLAYVNSSVGVKALCGAYGGGVCTSANAVVMLEWALEQGDCVLFLPDKNLGENTADRLKMPTNERVVLNVREKGRLADAGKSKARLLLWPGVCAVHFRLKAEDVLQARVRDAQARILVHPECDPKVVALADFAGSTSGIIRTVEQAPGGARFFVGTEDNLVFRLAGLHPDKSIAPLKVGYCSSMGKITAGKLLNVLENIHIREAVRVDPSIASNARKSLETMLQVMKDGA